MAILSSSTGNETLLPNGLRSWAVDIGEQIGQPEGHFFIQVVELPDDNARRLGVVSVSGGTINIGDQPIEIQVTQQPIDVDIFTQPIDVEIQAQPINVEIQTQPIDVKDTWEIITHADETLGNSDKSIGVTVGYEWQILWIWLEFITGAPAGNRQLQIDFRDDAADVIGQVRPGITQAASLTRYYMFAPALADLAAFRDTDFLMTPLPPTVFLPEEYTIRIFDNNAVSVAGDDIIVQIQIAQRAL